jgi:hypothetical protein
MISCATAYTAAASPGPEFVADDEMTSAAIEGTVIAEGSANPTVT